MTEQLACLNQRRIGNLYVIFDSDEPSFFAPLRASVLFKVPDKSCKSCDIRSKNIRNCQTIHCHAIRYGEPCRYLREHWQS